MAKRKKGVSGRLVSSPNAVRAAQAASKAAKRPGRPRAEITHPELRDYEFLNKWYSKGMTVGQIGEKIGVSKETVRRAMTALGIKRKAPGTYKTGEQRRRQRSPRSKPVMTVEQRNLPLSCPNCGQRQWYTPLKSDTWLCNACEMWFDVTCEEGALMAEEAQITE